MTRQAVPFIWPIRLPGPDGKIDDWNRVCPLRRRRYGSEPLGFALRLTCTPAVTTFTRPPPSRPEPDWPDMAFNALLRIAFKGKVIDTLDHPMLRRLRGEA